MAKRFIDTKMWDKAWFRKLNPKNKMIWIYILTRCDHAGIWDADWDLASFMIGEEIIYKELPKEIKDKMKHIPFHDQFYIPSFIEFQYGELRENSKPHLSVLKRLKDKGLQSVSYTLKDKVKVKDKEKLKDKESREKEFFDLVKKKAVEVENISDEQINNFIYYWTESNEGGKKMKFEMQKTFDIKRRLVKWRDNNIEWGKTGKKGNDSFESQFKKLSSGQGFNAYCSKCGAREFPNKFQLKEGSSCCRVEYVPKRS